MKKLLALKIMLYILIFVTFILIGFLFSEPTGRIIYESEKANLTRVIDGDSIETDLGKVRLLSINAPERGRFSFEEAKNFLLQFQGKEVELVKTKENKDRYGRFLRYLFFQNRFINKELLERGLAHLYYYKEDKFTSKLEKAEERARQKERGIWKRSNDECAECIILVELNSVDPGEYVLLENICSFSCSLEGWTIKDSATHLRKLNFSLQQGAEKKIEYKGRVWNDNGDSFFLRDSAGLLVVFYRY